MYEYRGLQDMFFMMLYGGAAFFALLACLYLLLRRGNAFADDIRSNRMLRHWTAAFMAVVCIVTRNDFFLSAMAYYMVFLAIAFIIYYVRALRQYGRWLLDNYADLERKELWQSLLLLAFILFVHMAYTNNEGTLFMEYLAQVNTIIIIGFLLWRVETLQELEAEESENSENTKPSLYLTKI